MDSAKSQLVDKLKSANNVLVTVSQNPSVDQLAACIGLTLLLNKLGKHAAAVFSGQVPSTLEFLKPDETFEKNTDSLRDFIIALDKSKADKLRYKVEDNVVRIFITPYKTSISQDDLEFSQGDFNVDVVVALGVTRQEELDEAITAHGRILHDATVATLTTGAVSELGSINWQDAQASSLSELVTELAQGLKGEADLFDNQIATALLTGIVAETDRFSNEKTSSQTMSASAVLMAAGANQQLVASELDMSSGGSDDTAAGSGAKLPQDSGPKSDDGSLRIDHDEEEKSDAEEDEPELELPQPDESDQSEPESVIDEVMTAEDHISEGPKIMTEAPTLGGMLTANTQPEGLDPSIDPLSVPVNQQPLLDHTPFKPTEEKEDRPEPPMDQPTPFFGQPVSATPPAAPEPVLTPPPSSWSPPAAPGPVLSPIAGSAAAEPETTQDDMSSQTLTELEAAVESPHLNSARDEVTKALNSTTDAAPEPIQALNAQPLGDSLHIEDPSAANPAPGAHSLEEILANDTPDAPTAIQPNGPQVTDSTAPPPVPPPIPFQFGGPNPPQQQ